MGVVFLAGFLGHRTESADADADADAEDADTGRPSAKSPTGTAPEQ